MPTGQPSNAPQHDHPDVNDDRSAAAVLNDDHMDAPPGGGGLGGSAAADPLGGSERGGGMTPAVEPADGVGTRPARDAQRESLETMPSTGGRLSGK